MDDISRLEDLPLDTVYKIFKFLNFDDIINFCTSSNSHKNLSKNRDFWMNYIDQIFKNCYRMLSNKSLTDLMKIAKCFSTPGNIYGCGDNFDRQLALPREIENVNKFTQIKTTNNIEKIYNLDNEIYYITSFGNCFIYNYDKFELVPIKNVKQICLYYDNGKIIIIFLTLTGTCYSMIKSNSNFNSNSIKYVVGLPIITQISGKDSNVVFLTDEGKVYGLGSNCFNQLGLGKDIQQVTSPTYMSFKNIVHIGGTETGTVLSTKNYDIYYISSYREKSHNHFTLDPNYFEKNTQDIQYMGNHGKIRKISCGCRHTAILMEDGRLYMLGDNQFGQLGLGDIQNRNNLELIENQLNIINVDCGDYSTAFITIDGQLFTFGSNSYNQLGLNLLADEISYDVKTPHQVMFLQDNMVKAVSCGFCSTLIIQ